MDGLEKPFYNVKELCKVLGIAPNTAYKLIHAGALESIKMGRSYIISRDDIIEFWNTYKGCDLSNMVAINESCRKKAS